MSREYISNECVDWRLYTLEKHKEEEEEFQKYLTKF